MNRKIGMVGSVIAGVSVILFALFMLLEFDLGSYLVCMFLAVGYVMMTAGFQSECKTDNDNTAEGYAGLVFAGIYAAIILLVYYAQTTAVRLDSLGDTAMRLLDYKRFGLFFDYDLLGYGMMSLSTFFTGLTIEGTNNTDRALKRLMMIHGIFFISCFIMPMLGVFSSGIGGDGNDFVGVLVLEIWCAYFLPISILSYLHFHDKLKG